MKTEAMIKKHLRSISYFIVTPILLSLSCCSENKQYPEEINLSKSLKMQYYISDFADSLINIPLDSTSGYGSGVAFRIDDNIITCSNGFYRFNIDGSFRDKVGKLNTKYIYPVKYPQMIYNDRTGESMIFYDNKINEWHIYDKKGVNKRNVRYNIYNQLRHKNIQADNLTFYGNCIDGNYYFFVKDSEYAKTNLAWIKISDNGRVQEVKLKTNDKTPFIIGDDNSGNRNSTRFGNKGSKFDDHLLMWGTNDTIYYIYGDKTIPHYKLTINNKNHFITDDKSQFAAENIIDTKHWLFIYIKNSNRMYYYDKDHKTLLEGNRMINDMGHTSFNKRYPDGYYYDKATDTEYIYYTGQPNAMYMEMMMEDIDTDNEETMQYIKYLHQLNNPLVMMYRLKK